MRVRAFVVPGVRMPKRTTTTKAGYGSTHQKIRRRWQDRIDSEGGITCWRWAEGVPASPHCARFIPPRQPSAWHLGHDDWDRSVYRGPECVRCNLAAAAAKTNGIKAAKRRPRVQLDW